MKTRSADTSLQTASPRTKRRKTGRQLEFQRTSEALSIPNVQKALLLYGIRQPYSTSVDTQVPIVQHDHELLVKVNAAGLNPIDWKAPDYNFGIPTLPYVSGRELVGTVVQAATVSNSRIQQGDIVIIPSTDYRDLRKAAFQEYSIASAFNTIRLPTHISINSGSILGVAFVSAVLALGICMGISFEDVERGPDLLSVVKKLEPERLPADIRQECLNGIAKSERAKQGDWLVIWGGSSTCAHVAKQLARLAGLKIVSVVDGAKHGLRLSSTPAIRPDLVVDSHDPLRAVEIIKSATGGRARFGFDTVGKETASHLLGALASLSAPESSSAESKESPRTRKDSKLPSPPATPLEINSATVRSHLTGLTGLPKTDIPEGVALHNVPIKLFHEIPEVGEALSAWCERLLVQGILVPPEVVGTVGGLEGINAGLDRMRRREVRGGRLVAILP
ncbi:GroES-like protein [Plenodomus tracheiphilus IPT5]|uniref:GroES-like protein n=1 Tax=Plenodomus tracheiphilus IPT5 TaxID=1408161 RepID=A0A6A7AQ21_9PLEO|nr:GroES-like protein [Plenodomus tracheiphilus IPT5]